MLALQGDVREHVVALESLGCKVIEVRKPDELESVGALVIPGGESTTIFKLAEVFGMTEPLRKSIASGLPVLGTCAGLILLAREILDPASANNRSVGSIYRFAEMPSETRTTRSRLNFLSVESKGQSRPRLFERQSLTRLANQLR